MSNTAALHSSANNRWFTPKYIIDPALEVLGPVDIDPASEEDANKYIAAAKYYTEADNGLSKRWAGTIWCNPPGGKIENKSVPLLFWSKLMETREQRWLQHAIFLAFSVEQTQTSQGKKYLPMAGFPLCIPAKRIRYELWDGTPGPSPTHSSVIVYVPGRANLTGVFAEVFSSIGQVVIPYQ